MSKSGKSKGPVHVVELKQIPNELREPISTHSVAKKKGRGKPKRKKQVQRKGLSSEEYEPSWVKIRYGAWYLKPEQWRVIKGDEQLADQSAGQLKEQTASKKKSDDMELELSQIHGSRAFRSFLERKQRRMPEFMKRVALLHDIADEQQRLEDEQKNEKNSRNGPAGSMSAIKQKSNVSMI